MSSTRVILQKYTRIRVRKFVSSDDIILSSFRIENFSRVDSIRVASDAQNVLKSSKDTNDRRRRRLSHLEIDK